MTRYEVRDRLRKLKKELHIGSYPIAKFLDLGESTIAKMSNPTYTEQMSYGVVNKCRQLLEYYDSGRIWLKEHDDGTKYFSGTHDASPKQQTASILTDGDIVYYRNQSGSKIYKFKFTTLRVGDMWLAILEDKSVKKNV